MTRPRLVVLVALMALWPAGASAQSDFIDWLAQLSGPGPFHGYFQSFNMRVVCAKDNDQGTHDIATCISDTDEKIKAVLEMNVAWASSGDDNVRFVDARPDDPLNKLPVNLFRIGATYSYRVSSMLDVGIGVGAFVFSGEGFTHQTHAFLTPLSVSFVPFGLLRGPTAAKWGRVLRIKYAERYIMGDLNAVQDFHALSSYLKHGEFNPAISIGLDFWSFLAR
jgi:hypothetical protein